MASSIYKDIHDRPGWIRVLTLHPPPESDAASADEQPLKCSLQEAHLDENPFYFALSYTWGNPKDTLFIELEGIEFSVTRNLHGALSQLRRTRPVTLWVDALCINQSSIPERNSQVPMMGRIYEGAEKVLIWLGPSFEGSHLAFSLIRRWSQDVWSGDEIDKSALDSIDGFREDEWDAARKFFNCAYWTRLWVYQEMVLAKHATIICGNDHIDMFQFEEAITTVGWIWRDDYWNLTTAEQRLIVQSCDISRAVAVVAHRQWRRPSVGLKVSLDFLLVTNHMTATDPRDRLYALLGVADESYGLAVDYGKTVEQVYSGFVLGYINITGRIDIILMAGTKADPPLLELPSWVPDFRLRKGGPFHYTSGSMFHPSGDKEPVAISFNDDESKIFIKGFIFDTVKQTSLPEDNGPEFSVSKRNMALAACPTGIYPDGTSVWQAIIRTMIGDVHLEKPNSAEEFCKLAIGFLILQEYANTELEVIYPSAVIAALDRIPFSPYVKNFIVWAGTLWARTLPGNISNIYDISDLDEKTLLEPLLGPPDSPLNKAWVPVDTFSDSHEGENNGRSRFYTYIRNNTIHRKLRVFLTTTEGYIGVGLTETAPGDLICILYGCDRPMIIRPRGNAFIIVGQCYVQGMMFGEALELVESGKCKERIFQFE